MSLQDRRLPTSFDYFRLPGTKQASGNHRTTKVVSPREERSPTATVVVTS
jgi:hypothetical protein